MREIFISSRYPDHVLDFSFTCVVILLPDPSLPWIPELARALDAEDSLFHACWTCPILSDNDSRLATLPAGADAQHDAFAEEASGSWFS
jgi:hypothetical protein